MGSGLQKEVRTAIERIQTLERDQMEMVKAINNTLNLIDQRFGHIAESIEAVSEIVGVEAVVEKVTALRAAKTEAQLAKAQAALDAAIADGSMIEVAVIGAGSLIVARETDSAGIQVHAGNIQLPLSSIKPEFQTQLLGKGVGTSIDTVNGGKFEVLRVYDLVERQTKAPEDLPNVEALNDVIDIREMAEKDLSQSLVQ